MPNIRFTRGGKWLHQQCKSYKWGSSNTTYMENSNSKTDLLIKTYKEKYNIEFTAEETRELYEIESENSGEKGLNGFLVGLTIVVNIILFVVGVLCFIPLVIYALISTPIFLCILIAWSSRLDKDTTTKLNEKVEEIKAKKQAVQERFERTKNELKEKLANLQQALIPELTQKYQNIVFNFIEMFEKEHIVGYFSLKENNFWFPISEENDKYGIAKELVLTDGFNLAQKTNLVIYKTNTPYYSVAYEKTRLLVGTLKEEIIKNSDYKQDECFTAIVYLIVRNNIIKYYHDKFEAESKFKTLKDLCANTDKRYINIGGYTYYYIYETNITLPILKTYSKISNDVADEYNLLLKESLIKSRKMEIETLATQTNDTIGEQTAIPVEMIQVDEPKEIPPIVKIDRMNGRQFERYIAQVFEKRGYKATVTPASGDYGIDVIIEDDLGVKIGIQAKCYSDKVPNSAIQEAVAGIRHYGCVKAMVITNNYFQPSAIQLAKENNVTLWDRNKLKIEIEK